MDKPSEQAREGLAQQRQQDELRQDAMRTRTEAELHSDSASDLDDQAREALTQQRQAEDQNQAALLERSEEELHTD